MLELEAEKGNFSQEITVSLQTQANDDDRVARIAKDGELVEVDAADVASLLVGAGIEEPPADSRIYVMGSSAPE